MKKDVQVLIRISELEKKGFQRASEISGISFSAWARQKLRTAAIKELQNAGEDIVFLTPITINEING
jgi:hypothetical protein